MSTQGPTHHRHQSSLHQWTCDETMGFTNATALQLLTHLHTTYGEVRSDQLEANTPMHHDNQWNPSDPIERV
jgi:hypothetical protein